MAPMFSLDSSGPLAPNQERLWFLHRLDPDSAAYNLPWIVELRGRLDPDALNRALDEIVRRHVALRCRFAEDAGEPRMVTLEAQPLGLVPEPVEPGALDATLRHEAFRPFDLARGPVVRFRLFRLAPEHHVLFWTVHHIVYDLASFEVMLAELAALYPGDSVPPLAASYLDFAAAAHRRNAEAGESAAALEHWRRALAGVEPLELPLDRPRPNRAERPSEVVVRRLSPSLTLAVGELARGRGRSTAFTPGLAAFVVLLRGLSGQDDLVVGAPVAGRPDAESRALVGFFVDLLALRVDVGDDPTFGELMDRLQETFLEARRFPHPPLDELSRELGRTRRAAESALVPVAFQLAREPRSPRLQDLEVDARRMRTANAKLDLRLDVYQRSDHLSLEAEYDAEIFDRATIERWLEVYVHLLEQAVERPDARISELTLPPQADLDAIRRANDVAAPFPGEAPLFEQFRRHAERTPEKPSVIHGDRSISYADLLARAESLADRLANPPSGAGVGPGDFVGLVAKRGIGLVEGMLGILAAGGAYVSLDPDYPEDRLRFMIDDAGIRVLLVEPSLKEFVPSVPGVSVLSLDIALVSASATAPQANEEPKAEEKRRPGRTSTAEACLSEASSGSRAQSSRTPTPKRRPPEGPRIDGDFPACLIYTSGSTGTPKASVLAQRGVTRLVVGTNYATFGSDDVFTQTASPSFDAATFEIWGAMLHGGTLVVVDRDDLLSPEALERTVKEHDVSVMFLTTAYFQQVARQAPSVFETPRAIFFGGERCEVDAVRRAAEVCARSGTRLFHAYGPSECTTYATVGEVERVDEDALSVPIGGPVANTVARVVDSEGRQVPVGVPGELWLGGPGLAHAYHRRPALTAERFVPDPFAAESGGESGDEPGARLYRTGDRVRWIERGDAGDLVLDFLGRVDLQVKIRGFRIEPGEIEAVLASHPAVAEAAVTVREDAASDGSIDKRLVGWAVLEEDADPVDGDRPDGQALRAFLADELPAFLVPSSVTVLDTFPLTANGKVDRRALRAIEPEIERDASVAFRAPSTESETLLAELWREVLGVERVGLDDDFFALGGHSLLAARLSARVRDRLGIEMPVRRIFESARLESLAAVVDELLGARGADADDPADDPAIRAEIDEARARGVLSFGQRQLYFLSRLEPESTAYNMPLALELRPDVDRLALARALREILRRHEILRTRYVEATDERGRVEPRAIIDPPPEIDVIDLVREVASAEALDHALRAEADTPFDLGTGVVRPRLFVPPTPGENAEFPPVLLFHVHHVAFDGWSFGLLRRELRTLYEALAGDDSRSVDPRSVLPEPPIQYGEHAARQRVRLRGERLDALVEPWRARLASLEPLDLPVDRPRPSRPTRAAGVTRARWDADTVRPLRELSRRQGRTLFTTLLAAFAATLQALTRRDDFALGIPDAGRGRSELEAAMGFFVDLRVLRLDLSGDPEFATLAERVHERLLDVRAHADVPLDKLVEELGSSRDADRNPFFQVVFQVLERGLVDEEARSHDPSNASDRLDRAERSVDLAEAKFDLSITVLDDGESLEIVTTRAAELLDAATVERWIDLFARVARQAAARPDGRLSSLDLLGEEDRRLIGAVNDRTRSSSESARFLDDLSLVEPVRRFAEADPDRVAIRHRDVVVTRGELWGRAEALGHRLVGKGVHAGELVGLFVERGPRFVEGLLGILAAGAAYVPLDPAYPADRLRFMIENANLRFLVTEPALVDALPAIPDVELVVLQPESESQRHPAPLPRVDGEFPAYVIFTSGSTGRPKGTVVPQRGVARLVVNVPDAPVYENDVVAQLASPSFDASAWETWTALANGATLAIVDPEDLVDPDDLAAVLRRHRVDVMLVTTAYFQPLVARHPELLGEMRVVYFGGERCDPEAIRPAAEVARAAGTALWNGYGPTETTVMATAQHVESVPEDALSVPIGPPVAHTTARVVDPLWREVGVGVPGELWIGGAGLAIGYLHRPALTAERFVPDPFEGGGERAYRTGDLVRWLDGGSSRGGSIDFLGRIDQQVKLRGFRIEPGEIEAVLARHPKVEGTVVVVREDAPGSPRLVAYATLADPDERPESAELRAFLAGELPDFLVPAAIMVLDALPVTPNGKVDRRALPAPVVDDEREHRAPESETEIALAEIWRDLLGVADPSLDDDFFVVGGHSLLAMSLASRLRDRFEIEMPVRALFETPTLGALARSVEERRADRTAASTDDAEDPEAVAAARARGVVSFGQRRLFFLQRLDPESTAYNMPLVFELDAAVDRRAIARAIDEIARRHEILRTRYVLEEGEEEPRAVVDPPRSGLLDERIVEIDSTEALEAALREEAETPFDLAREVLRPCLFVPAPDAPAGVPTVLVFHVHHVAFDGWSLGLLRRELRALFAAAPTSDPASILEPPAIQYGDYAARQRTRLAGERLDAAIEPWRTRLAGLEPLELPVDHARPTRAERRAGQLRASVPPTLADALREITRERGRTLTTVGLAVFATTLQALTGRDDLAVGVPDAGRDRTELESAMGFFVDMRVVRLDLGGDPDFANLVERVHTTLLDARAHGEAPFDQIVEALRPEREADRNPFFEVIFQVIEAERESADTSAKEGEESPALRPRPLPPREAKFDLALDLVESSGEGLELAVTWAADRFERTTVERWIDLFLRLAEQATVDPERRLSTFDLLSADDRKLLVEAHARAPEHAADLGADGAAPYPGDLSLIEQFRRHVEADPERVALVHHDLSWSRGELWNRARSLAGRLIDRGVRPGDFVGVCTRRGPLFVEAVLGVLAAGAAYVPVDPDYPADRLRFMIADAGLRLVLTEPSLEDLLPAIDDVSILLLTGHLEDLSASTPLPTVDGDFPAYVIFTSGSTGKPKGTVVPQRAVTRVVVDTNYIDFGPDDVVAQASSASFDAITLELWGALLLGGTLAVIDRDELLDPRRLAEALRRYDTSILFLTTAYFEQVAREAPDVLRGLRVALFGGERCNPEAIRHAAEICRPAGTRLLNGYGPTECTTFAAVHAVESVDDDALSVPIGPPIARTTAHVVDSLGREAGVGVPGELWLGGPGLALAYHRRPALTAERFVPNPFDPVSGARAYRTGDLVRWLDGGSSRGGTIDYLGRIDQQVKLRGFRIELGEIEAVLARHPHVGATAAMVREDVPGSAQLVAYATPAEGMHRPEGEALRSFLAEELPDFMVPSVIVVLDALPLTPNQKVDRRALPAPDLDGGAVHRPPASATERAVAEIWRELLGVERPGLDDDFFVSGGHSLLAVRLGSRLRDRLGVDLSVRAIFENSTVESLARAVDEERETAGVVEDDPEIVAAIAAARERGVLSFGQRRLWFLQRLEPGSVAYNMPFALRLDGDLDRRALERALETILRRHEILRTRYVAENGEPRAVVDDPLEVRLVPEVLDSEDALDARLAEAARQPFDLETGPVARLHLFGLADDAGEPTRHVLLFHVHHIAFDGSSYGILRDELAAFYALHLDPASPEPPPEPSVHYGDAGAREHVLLQGERLDALVDFWRRHLDGLEPLELPADRPRGDWSERRAASRRTELSASLSDAVRDLAREEGTTLFTTLLAAFYGLLQALTGRDDFAVGTPDAGRDRSEVENVIGFFVDNLVLRVDLSGDPSFVEVMERARESLLLAREHSDAPFEKLVEELAPSRHPGRNPLFDVSFQVLGEERRPALPGLEVHESTLHPGTAKFDLSMDLVDRGEGPMRLAAEWGADLFDDATVERWLALFVRILEQVTADPSRRLSTLDLLVEGDAEIAARGHRVDPSFDPTLSLAARVARRAGSEGDADAAVYADGRVTYRQLDHRARVLAATLLHQGTRPGDRVGLCLPRSVDWPTAALGVAYTGAAYVPLDPDYPGERLAFMVEDAGVRTIVGRGEVAHELADAADAALVELDDWNRLESALDDAPDEPRIGALGDPPPVAIDGEFPAYVIFTSGSTGRPKGVVVPHRAVANSALDPFLEQVPGDAITQGTSPSFDVASWEMWSALATGGKIVGLSREELLDLGRVRERVEKEGVTVMELPGPLFIEAASSDPTLFALARWSTTGGDRCDPSAVRAILAAGGRPINYYGPTEAAINATFHPVESLAEDATSVPIGRGVRNTVLRVLDPLGRPVPIGVAGELFLGGPSLAHGYLGRPALTAAAFVPDPFATEPGARLYCTGDLVRRLPTGDLDFLGRVDEQVKIRGFRVEPGEIEAVLAERPDVRHAAVEARPDADGRLRLVAWVETDPAVTSGAPGEALESGELLDDLRQRLPGHMVPAALQVVDTMPRTPSGKIDRKSLPDPETTLAEYRAPVTPLETFLAEIWRDILGESRVGLDDDFFTLGGHSLLAVKVFSRLEALVHHAIPLPLLFDHPTLGELAGAIESHLRAQPDGEDTLALLEELHALSDDEEADLLAEDAGAALPE